MNADEPRPPMSRLWDKVFYAAKKRGLKNKDVGERLGLSEAVFAKRRGSDYPVTTNDLRNLAVILAVNVAYLADDDVPVEQVVSIGQRAGEILSDDERFILETARNLPGGVGEAKRKLLATGQINPRMEEEPPRRR